MSRIKTPKSRSVAVRNVMRVNRGVDTRPEIRLRSHVHKAGLRYAIDARPELNINRRADLVFRKAKVAVFLDGCFWHGCPKHYKPPKSNRRYWSEKLRRNRERDVETRTLLKHRGWKVLVFWEHQSAQKCSDRVVSIVSERKKRFTT